MFYKYRQYFQQTAFDLLFKILILLESSVPARQSGLRSISLRNLKKWVLFLLYWSLLWLHCRKWFTLPAPGCRSWIKACFYRNIIFHRAAATVKTTRIKQHERHGKKHNQITRRQMLFSGSSETAFLPESPTFIQSSAMTSAQTWAGLCTSWQQGQAKLLGCRWLDGGLACSGQGWCSRSKPPFVFPKTPVQRQRGFNIKMQWAESKFDSRVLICAMCTALQMLVGKMFLIRQIPGHLQG